MESRVSLALATKLKQIFENESSFLSFPVGTGFSYRYLSFMKSPDVSGLSLQEQLNNKADFARLVNIVPSDSAVFSNDASRLLWDRLLQVLKASSFATSALRPSEEQALAQAIDLLTDVVQLADGSQVPVNSAVLNRYYEYKTLRDAAEVAYLDEKITVESSSGPEGEALRQRWAEYREKQLRDARDAAEQNWQNLGHRQQVQAAQQTRSNLEPKKYLNLYREAYLSDIAVSEIPDLNSMGIGFYTTFFSPFDVFDPTTSWNRVTLTRTEMASLINAAPADLRALFGSGESSGDFDSVSFEYSNVALIRPWFRPEFFASRTWKLADETRVSDGNLPRRGEIPAYITSMLVARNVVIRRTRSPAPGPVILPIFSPTSLRSLKLEKQTPPIVVPRTSLARASVVSAVKATASPASDPGNAKSAASVKLGAVAKSTKLEPKLVTQTLEPAPAVKQRLVTREFVDAKYAGMTIKSPALDATPVEAAPAPGSPETIEERYSFDGVTLLAWVCKRVPRSPDPDPGLVW
jgi:hypothetical protein